VEPSGVSEFNMTTAGEFARFCQFYLAAHPQTLEMLHSVRAFAYPVSHNVPASARNRPGTIEQRNRNSLLGELGVDGLKTGYIDESGYNIALTASQNGTRLVAVILGAESAEARDADGKRLLSWGFANYQTVRPPPVSLPRVRVWKSRAKYAALDIGEGLVFTARTGRGADMRFETEFSDDPLIAPLSIGAPAGVLVLHDSQGSLRRIPLVLAEDVPAGTFWTRLLDSIRLFFRKR
jgi:D-alanyl-D-alanine carboxypeptidase (penicillin-binding protein 5/6)